MIEQIHGVLCAVNHLDRLYLALKARLLDLLTLKLADTCLKLIFGSELGDRRLSQLMETMLALLPLGRRMASCSRHCTPLSYPARSGATCRRVGCP